jgi:hypothetical protein
MVCSLPVSTTGLDPDGRRMVASNIREPSSAGETALNKLLTSAFALSVMLGAGAAMAESMTGMVENVDPNTKTVVINGQPYQLEGQAAGLKIEEIKIGEKVTVEVDVNTNNVAQIIRAK